MAHTYDMTPTERAFTTAAVILAMLMQILDQTIANVALPHIAGLAIENASDTIALDAATRRVERLRKRLAQSV